MKRLGKMNTEFNSLSSLSSFNAMMNTEFNSLSSSSTVNRFNNNAIESNQMKKMIEDEIRKSVMEKYETSH